jgi:hypothetical protein
MCVMEKVYLLLRNNLQSGPYTIDELRQQKLKSTDLIWKEGESTAWFYPSELEELHAGTQAMPRVQVVPVPAMVVPRPVSAARKPLPADDIEAQAEALRKRALSYSPGKPWEHYKTHSAKDEAGTTFYRPEEDQIEVVIHRRERNFVPAQLVAAAMLTALAVLVWNQRGSLIPVRQAVESVAAKAATFENITAPQQPRVPATAAVSITSDPANLQQPLHQPEAAQPVFARKPEIKQQQEEPTVARAIPTVQLEKETVPAIREESIAVPEPVAVNKKPETVAAAKPETNDHAEPLVAAEPEKKKTIGQAIKGLFKKKKREEDKTAPVTEENG